MNLNEFFQLVLRICFLVFFTISLTFPYVRAEPQSGFCEVGESYLAPDGLTVTLTNLNIIEKTGSFVYRISYTLQNNKADEKILEGSFKMYFADETEGTPQYGFYNYLFPGDAVSKVYSFEELKSRPFGILEYHHENFFSSAPITGSLQWEAYPPDYIPPPITETDENEVPEVEEREILVELSKSRVVYGESYIISGQVIPPFNWTLAVRGGEGSGLPLTIQCLDNGTFKLECIPTEIDSYQIRLHIDADDKYEVSNSFNRRLEVNQIPVTLEYRLSSDKIMLDDVLTITGKISPQDGFKVMPLLNFVFTNPEGNTIPKVSRVTSDGTFSLEYDRVQDWYGQWIGIIQWEGDDTHTELEPISFSFLYEQPEPEPIPEPDPAPEEEPVSGIPGYPILSVLIGLFVALSFRYFF